MLEKLEQSVMEENHNSAKWQFALLSKKDYRLHEIRRENWSPIPAAAENEHPIIAFVDGGNASIIKTPSAELQRIRTAVVTTEKNRLTKVAQKEGYLLAKLEPDSSGKIQCRAELTESTLEISSGDLSGVSLESSGNGESAAALTKFCETARRIAEIRAATNAARRQRGAFIVLDGTLEAFNAAEIMAIKELMAAAADNGAIIGAVAKTCSLLADSGDSLISAVEGIGNGEGFIIVAEGRSERHKAAVAVARLNSSSPYLFRVEAATAEDLKKLLPELKRQSNDLAFPGYPYGLIMADRFARISNADAELTKTKIRATASDEVKALLKREKALNAHSVLDSM